MPRFCDPNATFRVWLDSDSSMRESERPTFVGRLLDGHTEERVLALSDAMQRADDNVSAIKCCRDMLWIFLTGFEHMPGENAAEDLPFARKSLDLLSSKEVLELLRKVKDANGLTNDDLGNSESSPSSEPAGSVRTAAEDGATTPQTNCSQPLSHATPVMASRNQKTRPPASAVSAGERSR